MTIAAPKTSRTSDPEITGAMRGLAVRLEPEAMSRLLERGENNGREHHGRQSV
jgi:hypothetical protein